MQMVGMWIPSIEVSYNRNRLGVWCPNRKIYSFDPIDKKLMRTKFLIKLIMPSRLE
jgi:hypothetical protein